MASPGSPQTGSGDEDGRLDDDDNLYDLSSRGTRTPTPPRARLQDQSPSGRGTAPSMSRYLGGAMSGANVLEGSTGAGASSDGSQYVSGECYTTTEALKTAQDNVHADE
jgi:hypothetical protein